MGAAGGIDREDESVPGTVTRLLSLVGRWASPDGSRAGAQWGRLDASLASSSLISHPISSSAAVASVAGAGRDNVRSRQRALQALGLLKGPARAAELEMGFGIKQRGPASLAELSRGLSLSSSLSVSEHSPLRVPVAVPREPRPFPPNSFCLSELTQDTHTLNIRPDRLADRDSRHARDDKGVCDARPFKDCHASLCGWV